MRHMVTALLLCLAAPVAAQDWQVITDEFALTDLLIAHDLTYETGAWQSFEASGIGGSKAGSIAANGPRMTIGPATM